MDFPPLLIQFPPVFGLFLGVLPTLRVFSSPYFYHDAFMHHIIHVGLLDVPGWWKN